MSRLIRIFTVCRPVFIFLADFPICNNRCVQIKLKGERVKQCVVKITCVNVCTEFFKLIFFIVCFHMLPISIHILGIEPDRSKQTE